MGFTFLLRFLLAISTGNVWQSSPCLQSFLGKYITTHVYSDVFLCNEARQYYVAKAAIHKHYSIVVLQGLL